MKKTASVFFVLILAVALASPVFAGVTISQVYGGGGSSGTTPPLSTYQRDYVELLNVSGAAVNVGGWVLAYAASTGSFNSTNKYTIPDGTMIQPCHYLLVECGGTGATGAAVPSPDLSTPTSVLSMAAGSGKIVLLSGGLPGTGICPSGSVVDFVGFGGANCSETSPTPAVARNTAAVRNNEGVTDTDNNLNDFTIVTDPVPRNSSNTSTECQQTPSAPSSWGGVKALHR